MRESSRNSCYYERKVEHTRSSEMFKEIYSLRSRRTKNILDYYIRNSELAKANRDRWSSTTTTTYERVIGILDSSLRSNRLRRPRGSITDR